MLDRKSAPSFSPLANFQLPTPEVTSLSNGYNLIHLNSVTQDVIKIELLFKAGKWFEPASGISHFTALLLDKGVPGKNAYQIASWFDLFGASLEIHAGLDFTSVSLFSLASNVHETLPLFFQLVTNPSFPDSELTQAKEIFAQNLKLNLEKNSFVASRNIRRNIFGETHPYGATLDESHLPFITTELLREYFNDRFVLHEVYVTGPLSKSTDTILRDLISQRKEITPHPSPSFTTNSRAVFEKIEKPESIQTSLRLGKKTINRANPDYPGLLLLNHLLGGYFGSRLMKNLREERGLTYGIHSSISTLFNDSLFLIGTDVNSKDQLLAIDEIKKEIHALSLNPASDSEIDLARNHLLGGIQLDAANPFSITDKIKMLRMYNLNSDYYNSLFFKIMNIRSNDLQKLAAKYLSAETLHTVAVG